MAVDNKFLLEMGMDMLSQPYTQAPTNAFTGMSEAYRNAIALQQIREQQKQEEEERKARMAQANQAQNQKMKQAQAFQGMIKGLPNADALWQLYQADPAAGIKQAQASKFPAAPEPNNYPGSTYNDDAAIALGLPPDPTTWTPQQRAAVDQKSMELRQMSAIQNAPANPYAGLGIDQDTALMDLISKKELAAIELKPAVAELRALSDAVDSGGAWRPTISKVMGAIGDTTGIDWNSADIAQEEALTAAANTIVPILRQGMASDPQFSDTDRQFLEARAGGLMSTPEGRDRIIGLLERVVERDLGNADFMYRQREAGGGEYSANSFRELRKHMRGYDPMSATAPAQDSGNKPDEIEVNGMIYKLQSNGKYLPK